MDGYTFVALLFIIPIAIVSIIILYACSIFSYGIYALIPKSAKKRFGLKEKPTVVVTTIVLSLVFISAAMTALWPALEKMFN